MIRNARTFFNAVMLGFLVPAAVLGGGVLWLNDQSPAASPNDAPDIAETSSIPPSSAAPAGSGTALRQPSAEPASPAVVNSSASLGETSRTELAAKIQQELRRLGCMRDAADGVWSEATSKAALTFVRNRQLGVPSDAPSSLLLLMLEADRSNRCSQPSVEADASPVAASSGAQTTTSGAIGAGTAAMPDLNMQPPVIAASDAISVPKRSSQSNSRSTAATDRQSTFSILHGNAP